MPTIETTTPAQIIAPDEILWICPACREVGEWSETVTTPAHREFCRFCFDAVYTPCADCNADTDRNDLITGPDDERRCLDCHAERYFTCDSCDDASLCAHERTVHVRATSGRMVEQQWCRDCVRSAASRCGECGETYQDEAMASTSEPALCQRCYEDNYFACESCSEICPNDEYEDGYCSSCYQEQKPKGVILDYGDESATDMWPMGNATSGIYLGVELEVEAKRDGEDESEAESAIEILGDDFVVCKHDGSLADNRGFEIVTCRASLDAQRERWTRFLTPQPTGIDRKSTRLNSSH